MKRRAPGYRVRVTVRLRVRVRVRVGFRVRARVRLRVGTLKSSAPGSMIARVPPMAAKE